MRAAFNFLEEKGDAIAKAYKNIHPGEGSLFEKIGLDADMRYFPDGRPIPSSVGGYFLEDSKEVVLNAKSLNINDLIHEFGHAEDTSVMGETSRQVVERILKREVTAEEVLARTSAFGDTSAEMRAMSGMDGYVPQVSQYLKGRAVGYKNELDYVIADCVNKELYQEIAYLRATAKGKGDAAMLREVDTFIGTYLKTSPEKIAEITDASELLLKHSAFKEKLADNIWEKIMTALVKLGGKV